MKKSKRTWLLLAGASALSAALLVPTVLSACSTTPPLTEEPGDDNNNTGPGGGGADQEPTHNKLAKELEKLNDTANASARKNIYTDYFKAINKTTSVRLTELNPPNLIKPTVTPLIEITKKGDFFGDLITLINRGLDVGDASQNGQISQSDLTGIVTKLVNEKGNMTAVGQIPNASQTEPTPGSIWSPNAFEFSDVSTATWTFISQDKNTVYELFLTENVDYKFESTVDKVSVKVSNKVGSDKTRSRLVVTTKKSGTAGAKTTSGNTTTPSATYESKTYNFKSNVDFALPSSLFDDFTSYLDAFDANVKKLKDYLPNATKKYKDLTSDSTKGFASSATLWNQFVTQNEESLLETMASDLNTNRSKSKIFQWIKANVSEAASSSGTTDTTLVGELQKDLEAAKSVNVDLDTLLVKGKNADNNGLNNTDSEEPDYTLIISFDVKESSKVQKTATDATVALDEKWYVLNLKATGFEFENTVNQDFFGYQSASFVTKPKLKLDAKSSFASYKFIETPNQIQGKPLVEVQKLKSVSLKQQDQFVDVSNLYDINEAGFTRFLSDLVINRKTEDTEITDTLLNINGNDSKKAITALKEYLKQDAEAVKEKLLEPNVLADLILDNIDLSNQVMYTNPNPTDSSIQVPDRTNKWKDTLNFFVQGGKTPDNSKKPIVHINPNPGVESNTGDNIQEIQRNKLKEHADISITENGHKIWFYDIPQEQEPNKKAYRGIYIFLGTESVEDSNAEAIVSGEINNVNLNINQPSEGISNEIEFDNFLNKVKQNFWIVLEADRNTGAGNTAKRMHGFYMGQEKKTEATKTGESNQTPVANQISFPISLDSLIVNSDIFLENLLKSDIPESEETIPTPEAIVPFFIRRIK